MADTIKLDNRDQYFGKSVHKNRYYSCNKIELCNTHKIRRICNKPYLTSFDVDFNLFARDLYGEHPDFYKLSEVNHERSIHYLESNAVSKRQNDMHTTYLIPIIGIFDYNDYDKDIKPRDYYDRKKYGSKYYRKQSEFYFE